MKTYFENLYSRINFFCKKYYTRLKEKIIINNIILVGKFLKKFEFDEVDFEK